MPNHRTIEQQNGDGLVDVISGAIDLFRSASRSNPKIRKFAETLQLAATAAKAEEHDNAVELLQTRLAVPLRELVRVELPQLLRQSLQQAIGDRFPDLVNEALRERLSAEVVEQLCQDILSAEIQGSKDLAESVSQLKESIDSQTNAISRLTDAGIEESILSITAPGFVARIRDQAPVKTEIARRVAVEFYSDSRRPSFVLASSTAVHLGLQLRRLSSVVGTLFFTNSVAFPLAVLNDNSHHEVGVFWQRIYDDQCGGWLPVIGDEPYFNSLRSCFRPDSYGLTTAVLTPRKLSVEHGMYFVRPETGKLARTLVENAQEAILMLPADRLCRSLDVHEQSGGFPPGAEWRRLEKPLYVVVAGSADGSDVDSLVNSLAEQGLCVHHQPGESTDWRVHPEN